MTKRQKRHRRAWIKALRSGTYRQGEGRLRQDGGEFCGLGVACDVYDPKGWCHKNGRIYYRSSTGDRVSTYLPPEVAEYFGVTLAEQVHLLNLNDEEQADFSQIASYIEANTDSA